MLQLETSLLQRLAGDEGGRLKLTGRTLLFGKPLLLMAEVQLLRAKHAKDECGGHGSRSP